MPSFIPGVDLEVVGNWFRLAHPKCKALDLKDALRLSRTVRALEERATLACDHDQFRAGDGSLVLAKLDQVSQRLPLQHQQVDVPFENTHGGFELLSTGVTDLAPELLGWYGAPGIDPCADTALFLVGDNFSVHQTRVIVGGQMLDPACPAACTSSACMPGSGGCAACASSGAGGGNSGGNGSAAQAPAVVVPVLPAPGPVPAPVPVPVPVPMPPPVPPIMPLIPSLGGAGPKTAADGANAGPRGAEDVQPANFVRHRAGAPTNPPVATANNTVTVSPTVTASPTASPTVSPTISPTITASSSGGGAATSVTATGTGTTAVAKTTPCVYQVELLSRQVMRIVIPKGVQSKTGMVDIHVATPYGVSPALSVPLVCESANCGGDKKAAAPAVLVNPVVVAPPPADYKPAAPAPDYSIPDGDLQVTYTVDDAGKPALFGVNGTVTLVPDDKTTVPTQLVMAAVFPVGDYTTKVATGPGLAGKKTTVLGPARLPEFAAGLLTKLDQLLNPDPNTAKDKRRSLPAVIASQSVEVTDALDPAGKAAKVSGTVRVVLTRYNAPDTAYSIVQEAGDEIQVLYTKDKDKINVSLKGKFSVIRNDRFVPKNPTLRATFSIANDPDPRNLVGLELPNLDFQNGPAVEVDAATQQVSAVAGAIVASHIRQQPDGSWPTVLVTAGANPCQITVTGPYLNGVVWTVSGAIRMKFVPAGQP